MSSSRIDSTEGLPEADAWLALRRLFPRVRQEGGCVRAVVLTGHAHDHLHSFLQTLSADLGRGAVGQAALDRDRLDEFAPRHPEHAVRRVAGTGVRAGGLAARARRALVDR